MLPPKTITQQGSRHLSCGSRQFHGRSRRRALAGSVLLAVTVLFAGCGDVLFVPSPYTPQKVELIYSTQEDISIVRWRISSTAPIGDDLRFQILGEDGHDDGYHDIDFSQSLFPGGASTCADADGGSCFQYVVRGQYHLGKLPPVRAVQDAYGTLPGELASPSTVEQTLGVEPFFHLTNDQVYASLTDAVAFEPPYVYPRSYDRAMWPTKGLCVSEVVPTGVSFSPLDTQTYGFPPDLPLSDTGIYCVGVRATPHDEGGAALDKNGCSSSGYCPPVAQARVATLPEVRDMHQTFVPPVEQSPVIYQIVFDLEIPVAERCASSLSKIESLVDKYMHMAKGVDVRKLPTINLATNPDATGGAPNCAQIGEGRTLPATDMADAVLQVVSSFPQKHQQFHFFYFNNQNFTLPKTLTDSLQALFNGLTAPAPYDLRTFSWLFNPGLAAATGPSWWMSQPPWQDVDDPSFEAALAMYVAQNLPYMSQTYDQDVPVPLLSPADSVANAGGFFKICASSPRVEPAYTSPPERLPGYGYNYYGYGSGPWSWLIKASDPPGYFVYLPQVTSVPGPTFTRASASVHFQVCTAYCDHPFEATNGTGATSWATSPLCSELP